MTKQAKTKAAEDEVKLQQAGTEVAVTGNQSTAVTIAGDQGFDLDATEGLGQETMTVDDFAIPRLGIVQSLSPQRQKTKPEYIEGAQEGQLFLQKELFDGDKGLVVIPISYQKKYLEWVPRADGGGFAGDHGDDKAILDKCTKSDKGEYVLENGNHIVPTAEYFVFIVNPEDGSYKKAVLSMAKSMVKYSKAWNTMINQLMVKSPKGKMVNPAMFYQAYTLKTAPESNDSGQWFRYVVDAFRLVPELPNGKAILDEAFSFYKNVKAGTVKAAAQSEEIAGRPEGDSDPL